MWRYGKAQIWQEHALRDFDVETKMVDRKTWCSANDLGAKRIQPGRRVGEERGLVCETAMAMGKTKFSYRREEEGLAGVVDCYCAQMNRQK